MAEQTAEELQAEADAIVASLQKQIAKVRAEYHEMGITMPDEMIALMIAKRATSPKLTDLMPSFGAERRNRSERSAARGGRPGSIAGLSPRRDGDGPA